MLIIIDTITWFKKRKTEIYQMRQLRNEFRCGHPRKNGHMQ